MSSDNAQLNSQSKVKVTHWLLMITKPVMYYLSSGSSSRKLCSICPWKLVTKFVSKEDHRRTHRVMVCLHGMVTSAHWKSKLQTAKKDVWGNTNLSLQSISEQSGLRQEQRLLSDPSDIYSENKLLPSHRRHSVPQWKLSCFRTLSWTHLLCKLWLFISAFSKLEDHVQHFGPRQISLRGQSIMARSRVGLRFSLEAWFEEVLNLNTWRMQVGPSFQHFYISAAGFGKII